MYLKEIYMKNFKSFGHEKRVPFRPGVTAITGPNGSGKSNIGDAILFVLGPKSPKAIRAERLPHLIFNGGKSGKPAQDCRVSLIFDNKDRMLPVDSDEVELTRRLKLSRSDPNNYYSYFYINGRPSQLNEFDKLLSHARISANGYNLVQQGDINQITSMSAVERRKIMDSIAGISIFDRDIGKANKDKEETLLNLQNIDLLLTEIENRLARLKRERDNAIKYQEIKKELEFNQARLLKRRLMNVDAKIDETAEHIERYKREIENLRESIRKNMDEKLILKKKLEQIENDLMERGGEEAEQLRQQIDELIISIARTEEAIKYSGEERQRLLDALHSSRREIRRMEKEIIGIEKEGKTASDELRERRNARTALNREIEAIRKRITTTNSKSMDIQREILLLKRKYEERNSHHHDEKLELDRLVEKRRMRSNEIEGLEESVDELEFEVKDINWRVGDLRRQSQTSSKNKKELDLELYQKINEEKKLVKDIQDLEHRIRTANMEYSRRKAETEAAEKMESRYKGGVSIILGARDSGELKGVLGTVAELSNVEEGYKTAISVAAGGKLQAVIVEDDSVAARGIQLLKRRKAGRVTFLPLNKMIAPRTRGKALMLLGNPGIVGLATELMDFDERYRNAFAYVLRDTVIVEDMNTAREYMGGVRLVTLEGELIDPGGAMTGGTLKRSRLSFGTSKGEVDRLFAELQQMEARHENLSARLSLMREEIATIQKQLEGHKNDRSGEIARLETERNKFHSRLRAQKATLDEATKELDQMNLLIQEKTGEVEGLGKGLRDIEEKVKELNEILLRATDRSTAESLTSLEKEKMENESIIQGLEGVVKVSEQKIGLLRGRIDELHGEISGNNRLINEGREKEKGLKTELADLREKKEALIKVQLSMFKEVEGIRKERDEAYNSIKDIEREIDQGKTKFSTFNEMLEDSQLKLSELEEVLTTLREEYAVQGKDVDETDLPLEEELKKLVKVLTDNMRRLEPVNMLAIREYESLSEKRKEKKENRRRLVEQKEGLEKVVQVLTEKKKRALDDIFREVNKNFREIYAILSNGGSAELIIENPENPFEGGLLISARPRGKKVHYLNALSGGEKSLTAIAFIFAIQRYMPSPFYYLDEVDMFLDGPNAGNVAAMLKANSQYAQIIIVSLRKVTLMSADNLYGVTMHGKGLSDIITFMSKDSLKYIAGDDLKDDEIEAKTAPPTPQPVTRIVSEPEAVLTQEIIEEG
ncbi:MAG: chromosome segregation protein SMC, partial [Thermoplasmata archaeon]|nr:chromosome segregation protein SMC [Thermoplasmata archaeon]